MITLGSSSDWSSLRGGHWAFYYGYEFDQSEDDRDENISGWGFEARYKDEVIFRISQEEMLKQYDRQNWDCWHANDGMLVGIAFMLQARTTPSVPGLE